MSWCSWCSWCTWLFWLRLLSFPSPHLRRQRLRQRTHEEKQEEEQKRQEERMRESFHAHNDEAFQKEQALETVRAFYAALNEGDIERATNYIHPQFEEGMPAVPDIPEAFRYGRIGFQQARLLTRGALREIQIEVQDLWPCVRDDGVYVIAQVVIHAEHTGARPYKGIQHAGKFAMPVISIMRLEDGMIRFHTEVQAFEVMLAQLDVQLPAPAQNTTARNRSSDEEIAEPAVDIPLNSPACRQGGRHVAELDEQCLQANGHDEKAITQATHLPAHLTAPTAKSIPAPQKCLSSD